MTIVQLSTAFVNVIWSDMNLVRIVDCLDEQLCQEIVDSSATLDFKRATTFAQDGTNNETAGRTNSQIPLPKEFEDRVHDCTNAALLAWSKQIAVEYPEVHQSMELPGVKPGLETTREPFSLLRYQRLEEYQYHTDASLFSRELGAHNLRDRLISVVIYVNDDFKGGETQFHGRKYQPVRGKALVFPSNWNYPHRSCPVLDGEKIAIVTWYHPRFQQLLSPESSLILLIADA